MELIKIADLSEDEVYIDRETGMYYLCHPGKRRVIKKGEPRLNQLIQLGYCNSTLNL
jgi:hypothetical protein